MFYSNFKCSVFQHKYLCNCFIVYSKKSMHSIQFLYTIWPKTYLHPPTSLLVLPPKLKTMAVTFSGRCGFLVYVPNPAIKTIISFHMDYHCDVKFSHSVLCDRSIVFWTTKWSFIHYIVLLNLNNTAGDNI